MGHDDHLCHPAVGLGVGSPSLTPGYERLTFVNFFSSRESTIVQAH